MAISKTARTTVKGPVEHDYKVVIPGWVSGAYRKKGDRIALTEAAATYEVLGGKLEPMKVSRPSRSKAKDPEPSKSAED